VSAHRCCRVREAITAQATDGGPRRWAFARLLDAAGWAVPGALLALVPKCPACLAGYVALGTGVSLSLSTATYLRTGLVALCVASLSYLAARRLRGFLGVARARER